jgi:hypothetical protein
MTDENNEFSMVAAHEAATGMVFYTFPEHFYTICETLCDTQQVVDEFIQGTGLTPDLGSASKDAVLFVLGSMSYTAACGRGYHGSKGDYMAGANTYFSPLVDQYLRYEQEDPQEFELTLADE